MGGFRVQGLGFRVQGLGFRVQGWQRDVLVCKGDEQEEMGGNKAGEKGKK